MQLSGQKHGHGKNANHHLCSDSGSGPGIVIVPGLPGAEAWFKYQSAGLADRYRVLVCNWPAGVEDGFDVAQLQASVLAGMDDAGVRSAAILGYQLGATVALRMAVEHPERTAALILASPVPGPLYRSEGELANYLCPGSAASGGFIGWLKRLFAKPQPETGRAEQALDEADLPPAPVDKAVVKSILKEFGKIDERPLAPSVDVPTLVVAGSREPEFVLSGAGFLSENIDAAEVEVIEGAEKHYFYTMNDRFNNLIQDFLTRRVASF